MDFKAKLVFYQTGISRPYVNKGTNKTVRSRDIIFIYFDVRLRSILLVGLNLTDPVVAW